MEVVTIRRDLLLGLTIYRKIGFTSAPRQKAGRDELLRGCIIKPYERLELIKRIFPLDFNGL